MARSHRRKDASSSTPRATAPTTKQAVSQAAVCNPTRDPRGQQGQGLPSHKAITRLYPIKGTRKAVGILIQLNLMDGI